MYYLDQNDQVLVGREVLESLEVPGHPGVLESHVNPSPLEVLQPITEEVVKGPVVHRNTCVKKPQGVTLNSITPINKRARSWGSGVSLVSLQDVPKKQVRAEILMVSSL